MTDDERNSAGADAEVRVLQENLVTGIHIYLNNQLVFQGDELTGEVKVDLAAEIAGIRFDLCFDPLLITVINVDGGDFLNQDSAETVFFSDSIDSENGLLIGVVGTIVGGECFVLRNSRARNLEDGSPLTPSMLCRQRKTRPLGFDILGFRGAVVTIYPDWDVNIDGCVNVLDMILVGNQWGETGDPHWARADVNRDGEVNVLDMILIGMHWTG